MHRISIHLGLVLKSVYFVQQIISTYDMWSLSLQAHGNTAMQMVLQKNIQTQQFHYTT